MNQRMSRVDASIAHRVIPRIWGYLIERGGPARIMALLSRWDGPHVAQISRFGTILSWVCRGRMAAATPSNQRRARSSACLTGRPAGRSIMPRMCSRGMTEPKAKLSSEVRVAVKAAGVGDLAHGLPRV
jgi:hypothetical protein